MFSSRNIIESKRIRHSVEYGVGFVIVAGSALLFMFASEREQGMGSAALTLPLYFLSPLLFTAFGFRRAAIGGIVALPLPFIYALIQILLCRILGVMSCS